MIEEHDESNEMLNYFKQFENRWDSKVDFMQKNVFLSGDYGELDATRRCQNEIVAGERRLATFMGNQQNLFTDHQKKYFLLHKQSILRETRKVWTKDALKRKAKKDKTTRMCKIIGFYLKVKKVHSIYANTRNQIYLQKKMERTIVRTIKLF